MAITYHGLGLLEGTEMKRRRTLAGILLFGSALRFGWAAWKHQPLAPGGDAASYLSMARSFASGLYPGQGHPPVFPIFLSLFYWHLGQNIVAALFIQSCLSTAVIFMAYRLASELAGENAGLMAAAGVAIDPFLLFYNTVFLSETLFTTLLMIAFILLLQTIRNASVLTACGCGLLVGVAILCRGLLLPCLPFFPLSIYLYFPASRARKIWTGLCCVAATLFVLGAWSGYVHHYTGHWLLVDSHKGENMYWAINPNLNNLTEEKRYLDAMKQDVLDHKFQDPLEVDDYLMNRALQWIRHHPGQYMILLIRKFFKLWSLLPHREIYSQSQRMLSLFFMAPLLLLAGIGLWQQCRQTPIPLTIKLILGLIAIYTLANIVIWTEIRYRVPIHPFLEILAGVGAGSLFDRKRVHRGYSLTPT
jgi:4-amino-4-deoxy-L-arabinose transferase-like glycosyltransferase